MKNRLRRVATLLCGIVLATGMMVVNKVDIEAATATATVSGTVASGTTADTLYLYDSSNGKYTIKLDSETNFNGCKILTVGKQITVGLYRGDDAYNHAATITAGKTASSASVDTSNQATVTGTVKDKSTEETLYLDINGQEMIIKLDSTTDMSGCRVVVSGANVNVVVARGSDAYMHALSISNGSGSSSSSSVSAGEAPSGTTAVTGYPEDKSSGSMLYLKTNDGTYQLKIDDSTDTSGGIVFTSSNKVTAYIYRGSDAYMHAAKVVGTRNNGSPASSNTTAFTGTVESGSTESMILLNTSGGVMKFKLDGSASLNGSKAIGKGDKITINGATGSDSYWHVVSIQLLQSANGTVSSSSSSSSSSSTGSGTAVTGTPTDKSTSGILYLKTNDGTYELKIDDSTDTSGGFVFTSSNKVTAYIYRGSDAYMHASKVVATRSATASLASSTTSFQGTVDSGSTDSMLLLNTSGGTMKIKIDSGTSLSGAKGLNKGRAVTVSASNGSDAYWHAVSITAK